MRLNLFDVEAEARALLPPEVYDYIAGGATDEVSLHRPRDVFEQIRLRPRVMVDVSTCDTETTVLGHRVPYPILVAPSGDHGIAHPAGEPETARGVAAAGTVMVASCGSTYSLEDIADAAPDGARWFHLPLFRDRGVAKELIRRAEASGYTAFCLTVDHKVTALRERNTRNGWVSPPTANLQGLVDLETADWSDAGSTERRADQVFDRAATWSYVGEIIGETNFPVAVKGVLRGDDALCAVNEGAAAVIVSDHGARQLDTTVAPIEVLPEVADAVGQRAEVYLDGGIRRGTDVLKALALGARAVLLGRPIMYGLAVGGADGVRAVLAMLQNEFSVAMTMCGLRSVETITRDAVTFGSPLALGLGRAR
jgi:4-hydroxymandelate oxidase